ncbi:MAG TPA: alpha/beta fold hydrolase [Methylibium sp.]|uniref:alpha/beta hydrolase n=1 Tax=Methylibium sp. TaxID=2067992 RepID=UPI002DBD1A48|nr:alpha/beta fold hydrolase [Methylibium sp.]HEU4458972.1 alpha/beta fold hydrolase [Methylibium sp.]
MNAQTQHLQLSGPAGAIEAALDEPAATPSAVLVVCHPHPQHGGTLDNKVVQTIARAGLQNGWRSLRFNFRGVGRSEGSWDAGRGEIDDALAVVAAQRGADLPLVLAGFSFGGFVAASVAQRLAGAAPAQRLALVAPSTQKQTVPDLPEALRAETFVVHGSDDEVVPCAATLAWAAAQDLPVTVLPSSGHFFHGKLALLKTLLLRAWSQPLAG